MRDHSWLMLIVGPSRWPKILGMIWIKNHLTVEKERISWGLFFSCHLREPRNITLTSDGNGGRACWQGMDKEWRRNGQVEAYRPRIGLGKEMAGVWQDAKPALLLSEAFWSMVLSGLLMSLLDLVLCSGPVRPVDVFQPCLNVSMSNFEFQYISTKFLSTKTWSVLVFWTEEWLDTRSPIHWAALGGLFLTNVSDPSASQWEVQAPAASKKRRETPLEDP